MKTIRKIKGEAVELLKNCWAESVLISLLELGIVCLSYTLLLLTARITGVHTANNVVLIPERMNVPFIISGAVIAAIHYIATTPLYFGVRWFFWQGSAGGDVMPVSAVFACYSSAETRNKCLRLRVAADLRRLGWAAFFGGIFAAAYFSARFIWQTGGKDDDLRLLLTVGCAAAALGSAVLYFIATVKYIPVGYIMAADPYADVREVIRLSRQALSRKNWYILKMYAGFIRHFPLIILIFPVLVLRPYMFMTMAVSIRDSLDEGDSEGVEFAENGGDNGRNGGNVGKGSNADKGGL